MSFSLLSSKQDKKKSLPRRHPVLFPFVVFICLLIVYQFFGEAVVTPGIGIVEVNGVILESEPIVKKLRILESDPAVRGIIVRINSPGGAVSPSQEIYSEILRLKKKKKVYVSISSTAASGGYYIAIAADKLFANPGSMIGSIGVIIQTFNVEGLMDKLGIKSEVIKAGKNKEGGLNEKGRKSYERENPGSDLKAPSKKVGNPRRASFCARMKGMKAKLTSKKTANDPDSRINKSLRAWNC